jgi:hypothetical protein
MSALLPVNRFALKEWAVVCAALAAGRQTVLLRKGGIEEGSEGFQPEHEQFWLMPTRFHQSADELTPSGAAFLPRVEASRPVEGVVQLELYARVEGVFRINAVSELSAIEGLHVLSPETVLDRFQYRAPGLWILPVRVFRRPESFELTESPHFAGCRSWVDLRNKLPTSSLTPVLTDSEFDDAISGIPRGG